MTDLRVWSYTINLEYWRKLCAAQAYAAAVRARRPEMQVRRLNDARD